MKTILILEDNEERIADFRKAVGQLGNGYHFKIWRDAHSMRAECEGFFETAALISLDHDLYKDLPSDPDPGTGRMIADLLSKRNPVCPVIVHSTNPDASWGMFNVLTSANWKVELVHHLNQPAWIEEQWLPVASKLILSEKHTSDR